MAEHEEQFKNALTGKKIPVLILDPKWHKLFSKTGTTDEIKELEKKLQEVLKRQGKLNNENKDLKKIKNNLMDEIVVNMDGVENSSDEAKGRKLEDNKRLINEVNEKLDRNEDELMELPREIDSINRELMIHTMELCYEKLRDNTKEIEEIAAWIREVRVSLKKNILKKQNKEVNNAELYAYMHDIFGHDVMELFDMKYEPTLPSLKKSENEKTTEQPKDETT
ncbi:MAG: hypothetical protein K6D90_03555 [Lachnospiraceae bacterium]|nr:hypothetical protein [Lachnospiraceae bacterium]